MTEPTLLTDSECPLSRQRLGDICAAQYLGVSTYMLKKWRTHGGGPRFSRKGKNRRKHVHYTVGALDQFIAEREMRNAIRKMMNLAANESRERVEYLCARGK